MSDTIKSCGFCGRTCREVIDKYTGAITYLCPLCGWTSDDDENPGNT